MIRKVVLDASRGICKRHLLRGTCAAQAAFGTFQDGCPVVLQECCSNYKTACSAFYCSCCCFFLLPLLQPALTPVIPPLLSSDTTGTSIPIASAGVPALAMAWKRAGCRTPKSEKAVPARSKSVAEADPCDGQNQKAKIIIPYHDTIRPH